MYETIGYLLNRPYYVLSLFAFGIFMWGLFQWEVIKYIHCDIMGMMSVWLNPLEWRHNGHGDVSNHQPHDCLLSCLFRHRSKKTSKLRVTVLCEGNWPVNSSHKYVIMSSAPHDVRIKRHVIPDVYVFRYKCNDNIPFPPKSVQTERFPVIQGPDGRSSTVSILYSKALI